MAGRALTVVFPRGGRAPAPPTVAPHPAAMSPSASATARAARARLSMTCSRWVRCSPGRPGYHRPHRAPPGKEMWAEPAPRRLAVTHAQRAPAERPQGSRGKAVWADASGRHAPAAGAGRAVQGRLLALFRLGRAGRRGRAPGAGRPGSHGAPRYAPPPRTASRMALAVCRRFSAWSKTTEAGPSMTPAVTSRPRWAGRSCRKTACGAAWRISASSTT